MEVVVEEAGVKIILSAKAIDDRVAVKRDYEVRIKSLQDKIVLLEAQSQSKDRELYSVKDSRKEMAQALKNYVDFSKTLPIKYRPEKNWTKEIESLISVCETV